MNRKTGIAIAVGITSFILIVSLFITEDEYIGSWLAGVTLLVTVAIILSCFASWPIKTYSMRELRFLYYTFLGILFDAS